MGIIPEAEPGFVAAVMSGLDASDLGLEGWSIRVDDAQAQLRWARRSRRSHSGPIDLTQLADDVVGRVLFCRRSYTGNYAAE